MRKQAFAFLMAVAMCLTILPMTVLADGGAAANLVHNGTVVQSYNTLKDAFKAAQDGDTVRLLRDVSEDLVIGNYGAAYFLDLSGCTLDGSIVNYGVLTVKTTETGGAVTGTVTGSVNNYGTLKIYSGQFVDKTNAKEYVHPGSTFRDTGAYLVVFPQTGTLPEFDISYEITDEAGIALTDGKVRGGKKYLARVYISSPTASLTLRAYELTATYDPACIKVKTMATGGKYGTVDTSVSGKLTYEMDRQSYAMDETVVVDGTNQYGIQVAQFAFTVDELVDADTLLTLGFTSDNEVDVMSYTMSFVAETHPSSIRAYPGKYAVTFDNGALGKKTVSIEANATLRLSDILGNTETYVGADTTGYYVDRGWRAAGGSYSENAITITGTTTVVVDWQLTVGEPVDKTAATRTYKNIRIIPYSYAPANYYMAIIDQAHPDGKTLCCDGIPLYQVQNENYIGYLPAAYRQNTKSVYLALVDSDVVADVLAELELTDGQGTEPNYNCDIDGDGAVTVNDASIVYQMMKGQTKWTYIPSDGAYLGYQSRLISDADQDASGYATIQDVLAIIKGYSGLNSIEK